MYINKELVKKTSIIRYIAEIKTVARKCHRVVCTKVRRVLGEGGGRLRQRVGRGARMRVVASRKFRGYDYLETVLPRCISKLIEFLIFLMKGDARIPIVLCYLHWILNTTFHFSSLF